MKQSKKKMLLITHSRQCEDTVAETRTHGHENQDQIQVQVRFRPSPMWAKKWSTKFGDIQISQNGLR